ncbi:hypothetical protein BU24DRAFT_453144 [Aaosphaeria arxii CBS 175.79]|uniref:DUF4396 domain-containing protein n=1 Tax=Aaosphaeria arxii CBS 175.79 TaxID=1450172 RepID=A0A6A5XJ77_9PLEO|nr:uncharacterized protein BU24DRAFT_453144 [Aaosphaeria arxii CBS 175.79]KAF2012810.1 hypothetical protein BU24DRAFT_453144 [Aaosphaeria arxii CBS 175.79]
MFTRRPIQTLFVRHRYLQPASTSPFSPRKSQFTLCPIVHLSTSPLRPQCTKSNSPPAKPRTTQCQHKQNQASTISPWTLEFWSSTPTLKRACINTFRCLVGCTTGDFSAMWYLQAFHPELGMGGIMGISMLSGITTSILLETVLLHRGRDAMPWVTAAQTAVGMSMISMLTMELAENAVDFHLTGGVVKVGDPGFWGAAGVAMGAGFVAPLPYNYWRLRKWGRGCH